MTSFIDRAEEMGLNIDLGYKGFFNYSDRYSEIIYRQLISQSEPHGPDSEHQTDGYLTPLIAIFTKGPEDEEYKYVGYVSSVYKFIGNDVLNEKIRAAIQEVGVPIVRENTILSYDYTRMRNEIIIQNGENIPQVGDVLPVMIVSNSYNGSKAASISYGITFQNSGENYYFAFNLGEMRQIHIANSPTSLSSSVNSYLQFFHTNITEMITQTFSSRLTETEMLGTLDLIEKIGKKKRESISAGLNEIQGQSENELPTAWQMFLAIVRYSSIEPNLNIKRMMENVAESVLVIPTRMMEVLSKINEAS